MKRVRPNFRGIQLAVGSLAALATLLGCATAFAPEHLRMPDDLGAVQSQTRADVTVSAAILTDEEAARHFGVGLGERELQALWLSVRNESQRRLWLIRNAIDPDFYSADEVALVTEAEVAGHDRAALHQHLRDESIRVLLAPRTVTEGFLFLPKARGGRYLDIRLQGDAYLEQTAALAPGAAAPPERELRFGFSIALPDGDFDYERLDPSRSYAGKPLPDLTTDELRRELEKVRCCATGPDGMRDADPLNLVIVGDTADVLNSLSRSGWSFTHRLTITSMRQMVGAAVAGTPYPFAPVSSLYAFGRKQDVALQRARRTIAERNHMRLWLAPFRCEGQRVWIGQISRDIGIKLTTLSPTLTTHVIDPQVDATREYLLHSLIANGFVDRFGFVRGGPVAPPSQPRRNLTDDPFFSDGMRLVVVLSPEPISPERVRSLLWEQSAAPIAEGQSEAALRNVRPLDPPEVEDPEDGDRP